MGLMDHPSVLRNPSLLKAKINDIFKTSLLSSQHWLLRLIQYNILLKERFLNNVWPKLANILQVFLAFSLWIFKRHLNDILPVLTNRWFPWLIFSAFWMGQLNGCIHYIKLEQMKILFKLTFKREAVTSTLLLIVLNISFQYYYWILPLENYWILTF